jgi:nucleoid-associated protein
MVNIDFFMDFLGASEGLNAKAQNRGLLQAVDDFAADAQALFADAGQLFGQRFQLNLFPGLQLFVAVRIDLLTERQNVRQQVYAYCNEQLQAGEEIELESLSKELAGVSAAIRREALFQFVTLLGGEFLEALFADAGQLFGPGVSEKSFQEFTAEQGYELEESFPADRSTLRQLMVKPPPLPANLVS